MTSSLRPRHSHINAACPIESSSHWAIESLSHWAIAVGVGASTVLRARGSSFVFAPRPRAVIDKAYGSMAKWPNGSMFLSLRANFRRIPGIGLSEPSQRGGRPFLEEKFRHLYSISE